MSGFTLAFCVCSISCVPLEGFSILYVDAFLGCGVWHTVPRSLTFTSGLGSKKLCPGHTFYIIIPRQSRRDMVLASSITFVLPSVHTFCLSGTISQYLLVKFGSFLVQMISTMNSRYPLSCVKMDPVTLELLPLF